MPSASATPSLSAASFDLSPASAKKTWEVELEGRAGLVVRSALRSAFPLPKDKAWLVDFLAESILVEMQGDGQTMLSSLPGDAGEAESSLGPLLYDNMDGVDGEEVADFCRRLLRDLAPLQQEFLAKAHEADGSSSGAGEEEEEEGMCEMCGRDMPLTKHHLIPRDVHKEWKRKGATQEQLQAVAMICRSCHNAVHRVADNKTLAARFNRLADLMQVESIQRHVVWASKQKVATTQFVRKYKPRR